MNKKILPQLQEIILSEKQKWTQLAQAIWHHPEPGFEETFACGKQVDLLKEAGFQVELPFGGLDTAYKATFGSGGTTFCFVAEYDALPKLGHACGHNLICTAAVAAGCGLASLLKNTATKGTVVVLGTPAEEIHSGKSVMLENADVLEGIDALILAHPLWQTLKFSGSYAVRKFQVGFRGQAAHAAASPERGLNALDAVLLLFQGINAWRQHLPETTRLHGVITDGGKSPNIIPDYAECRFYLRALDDAFLDTMETRFRDIVRGASLMTGTTAAITHFARSYKSCRSNKAMEQCFWDIAGELNINPKTLENVPKISSDFGDFSHLKPGIHPFFGICREETGLHSEAFADAAKSAYAIEQTLTTATAMAAVGYTYLTDDCFRKQVLREH